KFLPIQTLKHTKDALARFGAEADAVVLKPEADEGAVGSGELAANPHLWFLPWVHKLHRISKKVRNHLRQCRRVANDRRQRPVHFYARSMGVEIGIGVDNILNQ